jgi:hypothetical protein
MSYKEASDRVSCGVLCGGGYMSYEAEDTCHMKRRLTGCHVVSYKAEDICHMRRRIHVSLAGSLMAHILNNQFRDTHRIQQYVTYVLVLL